MSTEAKHSYTIADSIFSGFRLSTLPTLSAFLFVVSGFSALIYQSVWANYLGLILGHAAYAQALVLSIFMGGLAIGSWLTSKFQAPPSKLLKYYALAEGAIGVFGLIFHSSYLALSNYSLNSVLPSIDSTSLALSWQWLSGALLVLPQSILLGTTFPLLGNASVQVSREQNAATLGNLYFSNSIGAAFGALAATFFLVPRYGTPGALSTAATLNLVVALIAVVCSKKYERNGDDAKSNPAAVITSKRTPDESEKGFVEFMLIAAFITGLTSFIYEIGWIRMLSLTLGATQHTFELMLSAFILGLALGGLALRLFSRHRKIDLVKYAGLAQIAMGIATFISLILYAKGFDIVEWVYGATSKTPSGYAIFLSTSSFIAMLTVFPAALFAGMTLPLMTSALLSKGGPPSQIGKIYSANTFGAIAGVFIALFLLIPTIGVRLSIVFAAFADIVLGVVLLRKYSDAPNRATYIVGLVVAMFAYLGSQTLGRVSPEVLTGGVFRTGSARIVGSNDKVFFLKDGRTATVSLYSSNQTTVGIATNGKPDASIETNTASPRSMDEITMVMAGALPLVLRDQVETVAVIGFGSGLTTHTVLTSNQVRSVETIEIEQAMVEAAKIYRRFNHLSYDDKRSTIVINDARTHFAIGNRKYDAIISEPSNPWVNGVASLFTIEFYDDINRHLNDDGVFVQWLQGYEISDELIAPILAALRSRFPNVDVYVTNTLDFMLVASRKPHQLNPELLVAHGPQFEEILSRVGLYGLDEFRIRQIADSRGVEVLANMHNAKPHSDFFPVLALKGPEARYRKENSIMLTRLQSPGLPVRQMAFGAIETNSIEDRKKGTSIAPLIVEENHLLAKNLAQLWRPEGLALDELSKYNVDVSNLLKPLSHAWPGCDDPNRFPEWENSYVNWLSLTTPYWSPEDAKRVLQIAPVATCPEYLELSKLWVDFGKALYDRDSVAIVASATSILNLRPDLGSAEKEYLIAAIALSKISTTRSNTSNYSDQRDFAVEPNFGLITKFLLKMSHSNSIGKTKIADPRP